MNKKLEVDNHPKGGRFRMKSQVLSRGNGLFFFFYLLLLVRKIDTNMAAGKNPRQDDNARWIAMILEGGRRENTAMKEIYDQNWNMVINYVKANKGRKEDGENMMQDAIMVVLLNVQKGVFRGESSLKNYLMRIVRNMWLNELRRQKPLEGHVEVLDGDQPALQELAELPRELELINDSKLVTLLQALDKLHKGCMAILKMFYWYEWPLNEIAEYLNYPSEDSVKTKNKHSEDSVKTKKKRCMDELKRYLDDHPDLKDFLSFDRP
jgi:RNA polymerase sigma factor (sigma-70 family)